MQKRILLVLAGVCLLCAGYFAGTRTMIAVHANGRSEVQAAVQSNAQSGVQAAAQSDVQPDVQPDAQANSAYVRHPTEGNVPKSYGRLVAAIPDRIGTGLIFEDGAGVIRFVSITGMKEGELARYDKTPTRGGIPKSYGHLVTAVVGPNGTGLIFEDAAGTIRFCTITGVKEGELTRE